MEDNYSLKDNFIHAVAKHWSKEVFTYTSKIRFSPEMGVMAFVLLPVVLLVLILRPDEQQRLPPRRAREVLEPHSREYYLANLNYIIRSHQEQPFNMWPDVLSELYGIDHRLRVYYYREGIYLIADPVERTNKHHFAESAGLATVLQETAPGYQGLVLLCARENLEHCILHGKGKVPWLTRKERATLKSMAKFYRMAPDTIRLMLEYETRNYPPSSPN